MSSARHVSPVRDIRNACRIFAGNPERKRLLRRFKTLRQENIREIRSVDAKGKKISEK
jgi:hypothetical protein